MNMRAKVERNKKTSDKKGQNSHRFFFERVHKTKEVIKQKSTKSNLKKMSYCSAVGRARTSLRLNVNSASLLVTLHSRAEKENVTYLSITEGFCLDFIATYLKVNFWLSGKNSRY